jgi:FtsP/CotA-like multicopper oxidase with cupredoxin domain
VLVGPKSSVRFAVRYNAPGMWMYHCQIPEHAERGMMGEVMVAAP